MNLSESIRTHARQYRFTVNRSLRKPECPILQFISGPHPLSAYQNERGLAYHEWTGVEFVRRVAALIPPARKHVVRYYEALGPCSPIRSAVKTATKGRATDAELRGGYSVTLLGRAAREVGKASKKAGSAALRSWAA